MIINFEEITEDLTEVEIANKEDVKRYLQLILSAGPEHAVKQNELSVFITSQFLVERGINFPVTTVRLRKYFNYFRTNGILPIIATQEGCYISNNKEEIQKQVLSMEQRARSIQRAAEGMKKFIN